MDSPSRAWHYFEDGQRRGPISEEQLLQLLRSGVLSSGTMVWTEGMPEWQPVRATHLGVGLPSVVPPPPFISFPPASVGLVAERKSRIAYILLAVLVGLGVHNFYAGYTNRAVLQLLLCMIGLVGLVLCCGVGAPLLLFVWIWGVIEACTTKVDGNGVPFQG